MKFSMRGQEKVTCKYRWLLNRSDLIDRFDCTYIQCTWIKYQETVICIKTYNYCSFDIFMTTCCTQSSRLAPVVWSKSVVDHQHFVWTSRFFSFYINYMDMYMYIYLYIKINLRTWFGLVNSNFHFKDCVPQKS